MQHTPGIYNNNGFVQIRVWPWPKASNPKPYTEGKFGCWCEKHIKDAERRLRTLRDEIESGKFTKNRELKRILFRDGWDAFYHKHHVLKRRSRNSLKNVRSMGKRFKTLWGHLFHDEFTPAPILEDFVNKTSLRPSTVKLNLAVLQVYFEKMAQWSKLKEIEPIKLPDFNPVEPIERQKVIFTGRKHLEIGEIRRFRDWCLQNDPEMWVAAYAAMTTLLRHEDLNSVAGLSQVRGIASKTGKVFMLPGAVPRAANLTNFRDRWVEARKGAGIEWFHWHWWRAQGAKLMRMLDVPEATVQEILQHSSVQQTRAYTGDAIWAEGAVEKVRNFLDNLGSSITVPSE